MKKIIALISVIVLLTAFPITSFANDNRDVIATENGYIEYYEDGSYAIVDIIDSVVVARATGVTKDKRYTYYNDKNEAEWTVIITGTFNYDGKTASCTKAVASYKIYNDSWKVTASNASKSGAKAIGDFTVKRYWLGIPTKTVNKTLTLTCSKDGAFS